jgi:hypothetical protein
MEALHAQMIGRTVLLITHRLAGLQRMDKIVEHWVHPELPDLESIPIFKPIIQYSIPPTLHAKTWFQ